MNNQVAQAVLNKFLPKFAKDAVIMYVASSLNPDHLNGLVKFGLKPRKNIALPSVVAYCEQRNWFYMIDTCETSPASTVITEARLTELSNLTRQSMAETVFVTAFENKNSFANYADEIAWESHVWTADNPEHMIHFNGDKFLGPYAKAR